MNQEEKADEQMSSGVEEKEERERGMELFFGCSPLPHLHT